MKRLIVVIALVLLAAGCSKSATPGLPTTNTIAPLPFHGSPSRDELQRSAGISFPESTSDYRSVRVDPAELDVAFTLSEADVDAFIAESHLPSLTDGRRLIVHASPVWEQNPTGVIRSTSSEAKGVMRTVEVVTDGSGSATARLSISTTPE